MIDFGQVTIGSVTINSSQIIILCTSLALMAAVSLLVYKTKMGKAMLAVSQSSEAAQLMGINVNGIISLTFVISSSLAAIAGTMVGMYYQNIDATMGFSVGMKTLASAVLGGVGILPGAMVGGKLCKFRLSGCDFFCYPDSCNPDKAYRTVWTQTD